MTLKLSQIQKSPEAYAGKISVCGWVRTVREGKNPRLCRTDRRSCFTPVQIVFERDDRNLGNGLSTGCAIAVEGELVITPDAPQPFEIRANEIVLEGACPSDYPLQKKRHTLEYLRTIQHLRRGRTLSRRRSAYALLLPRPFTSSSSSAGLSTSTRVDHGFGLRRRGEMFQVTTLPLNDMPKDKDGKVDFSGDFFGKPPT
jgi:asparaginyl-tRNA synthetase